MAIIGWERPLSDSDEGKRFGENILVQMMLFGAVFLLVADVAVLAYFVRPVESLIVLHYNVYFGVDILGVWWQAYVFPAVAAGFLLWHGWLAYGFYRKKERIAAYLLLLGTDMLIAGMLIAGISVARINY